QTPARSGRVVRSLAPPVAAQRRPSAVDLGRRRGGGCLDDTTRKRECAPKKSAQADSHQWRFARRFLIGVGRRRPSVPQIASLFLEVPEIRVQSQTWPRPPNLDAAAMTPGLPQLSCGGYKDKVAEAVARWNLG